jgi:hypothetical protein
MPSSNLAYASPISQSLGGATPGSAQNMQYGFCVADSDGNAVIDANFDHIVTVDFTMPIAQPNRSQIEAQVVDAIRETMGDPHLKVEFL